MHRRTLLSAVALGMAPAALPVTAWPRENAPAARAELWKQLAPFCEPPAEWSGDWGKYASPLVLSDGSRVASAAAWPRRRRELAELWLKRLGGWPPLVETPQVKVLETITRAGIRPTGGETILVEQQKVQVQVSPTGEIAEGYLLTPPGDGPFPAVLVPFYEPLTSAGLGAKGRGTHDYGWQLAQRGFVTLSIGTPGALERIGDGTRELLTTAGEKQRRQPLSILAYVAANCHTVLAKTPRVDPARIGIIGLSYGGKWAMFATCLYEKFACAVWSDPGIVFDEQNSNVNYWEPWYLGYDPAVQRKAGVPSPERPRTGLYKELHDAGCDLVDLHALAAPRPVLVSGGTEDPPRNWRALNHLREVNRLLGHTHRVALTARKTHVPTPAALEIELAWLEYWLGSPGG